MVPAKKYVTVMLICSFLLAASKHTVFRGVLNRLGSSLVLDKASLWLRTQNTCKDELLSTSVFL